MIDPQPVYSSEPEAVLFQVYLKGAGAAVPTLFNTRNNYTIARTAVGKITITFQDDPGPTFQGLDGGGFGDTTNALNVAGWTVVGGAYVARNNATPASFSFTICNSVFAAADLPATSTLSMQLAFKQAAAVE